MSTDETNARAIMRIFKLKDVQAGHILMAGAVNMDAVKAGLSPQEYQSGLSFAVNNGWLDGAQASFFKLTDAGYAITLGV